MLTGVKILKAQVSDVLFLQRPGLDTAELSLYLDGFTLADYPLFFLFLLSHASLSVFLPLSFLLFSSPPLL